MDVLLTHGYYLSQDAHEQAIMRPYPPLGILYISAYLKARGFAVEVFDTTLSDPAAFDAAVTARRPPVVGMYANMMTRKNLIPMIRRCKALGAAVVLGGPDPANYPERYLERGVDIIVIGEGELALEEILTHLRRHGLTGLDAIQGIIYAADDGGIVRTPPRPKLPDLDQLPFPDRAAIDLPAYLDIWRRHHGMGPVSLITARGCPYTCTWCSHAVYGYSHRRRSPANVADEVQQIIDTYQPDALWYADDVFTIHRTWFLRYAEELRRRKIRLPFETISREDRLNEEIVRALAEMGCTRLWVGAESGSQRVLDAMQRRTDAARMREMIGLLQRHGIEAGTFIMLGYEGEEVADIEETVRHLTAALPDRLLTTVAYPIKGTPFYEQVAERVIPLAPWEHGSDREATIAGRRSQRFYSFATRWMVNEVTWRKERRAGSYRRMARAFLSAKLGRLGMAVTRHEREERRPVHG